MPEVSIIIPTYNQGRFVRNAIQSALDQTYRSFEIIVVDDGSTDNCWEVVANFGSQVRYLYQENQGLAGARNTGIRAARGELIALLDADDLWLPAFLETMDSLTVQYPKASVYYCCAQGMDKDGLRLPQVFGGPPKQPDALYQALLRANFLIPSTILMRRSVIVAAGLFDQRLRSCEDWDLWLRLLPGHVFVGTSACLALYRLHGSSLSANPTGMQKATRAVIEKHFGPDDAQCQTWSGEKRRAYGGVYRYHLLTSVQRQADWDAGARYLRQALQVDPTLAEDADLFYDLALGNQPQGHRGSASQLTLESNAQHIGEMLASVFYPAAATELDAARRPAYGTAHLALGLVAYNTGQRSLSRRYLLKALTFRPDLWRNNLIIGNLLKSLVRRSVVERIRRYAVQPRH